MLDPEIRELLHDSLDTFEKLEVALALVRAPGQALSMAELVHTTKLAPEHVYRGVEELRVAKLVNDAGGLVRLVVTTEAPYRALAELHARDPSAIAVAMSELALDKIRGMAAHTFGEALVAARKKDDP